MYRSTKWLLVCMLCAVLHLVCVPGIVHTEAQTKDYAIGDFRFAFPAMYTAEIDPNGKRITFTESSSQEKILHVLVYDAKFDTDASMERCYNYLRNRISGNGINMEHEESIVSGLPALDSTYTTIAGDNKRVILQVLSQESRLVCSFTPLAVASGIFDDLYGKIVDSITQVDATQKARPMAEENEGSLMPVPPAGHVIDHALFTIDDLETMVRITMTVEGLPEIFEFNKEDTTENALELKYALNFVIGDQLYTVASQHFKFGSDAPFEADFERMQSDLWEHGEDSTKMIASCVSGRDGDVITWIINKPLADRDGYVQNIDYSAITAIEYHIMNGKYDTTHKVFVIDEKGEVVPSDAEDIFTIWKMSS